MNQIQIARKITRHLLSQGFKAQTHFKHSYKPSCVYLAESGASCAIGCLIPTDSPTHPEFDSEWIMSLDGGVDDLLSEDRNEDELDFLSEFGISDDNFALLEEAQRIHDKQAPSTWPEYLITFMQDTGKGKYIDS